MCVTFPLNYQRSLLRARCYISFQSVCSDSSPRAPRAHGLTGTLAGPEAGSSPGSPAVPRDLAYGQLPRDCARASRDRTDASTKGENINTQTARPRQRPPGAMKCPLIPAQGVGRLCFTFTRARDAAANGSPMLHSSPLHAIPCHLWNNPSRPGPCHSHFSDENTGHRAMCPLAETARR